MCHFGGKITRDLYIYAQFMFVFAWLPPLVVLISFMTSKFLLDQIEAYIWTTSLSGEAVLHFERFQDILGIGISTILKIFYQSVRVTKKNLSEDQKILDYYNVYALGVLISGLYMISKRGWGWLWGIWPTNHFLYYVRKEQKILGIQLVCFMVTLDHFVTNDLVMIPLPNNPCYEKAIEVLVINYILDDLICLYYMIYIT